MCLTATNTPAYYDKELITAIKSFIAQTAGINGATTLSITTFSIALNKL
jgi:hypothetical protein